MASIALFEPEIPHNTGALMRLGACLNISLHLIEPLGFLLSDKHLKRSGMDYRDKATIKMHINFEAFKTFAQQKRVILFDTEGKHSLYDFKFETNDILLFGTESRGVPSYVKEQVYESVYIPMVDGCRSLNLALSAAMGISEAIRQSLKT